MSAGGNLICRKFITFSYNEETSVVLCLSILFIPTLISICEGTLSMDALCNLCSMLCSVGM